MVKFEKSPIDQCQIRCVDLTVKLGLRLTVDTNLEVKKVGDELGVIKDEQLGTHVFGLYPWSSADSFLIYPSR